MRSSNSFLYLDSLKESLSLVFAPVSGANKIPKAAPTPAPKAKASNVFVVFPMVVLFIVQKASSTLADLSLIG